MNSVILQGLRAYCKPDQSDWHELLPSIMLAFRTTPATQSTGLSPYFVLFGKECTLPIDTAIMPNATNPKLGNKHMRALARFWELTKSMCVTISHKQKQNTNNNLTSKLESVCQSTKWVSVYGCLAKVARSHHHTQTLKLDFSNDALFMGRHL